MMLYLIPSSNHQAGIEHSEFFVSLAIGAAAAAPLCWRMAGYWQNILALDSQHS
jgi:hypothetical protein